MKKIFILLFIVMIYFFVVACTKENTALVKESNQFVEEDNIQDAEKLAGFKINIPCNILKESSNVKIRAMKDEMIEVVYKNYSYWIIIRKAVYDGQDDISGDYNDYPEEHHSKYAGMEVVFKGSDGKVNHVFWKRDEYVYSININPGGVGIDYETLYEIIWNLY